MLKYATIDIAANNTNCEPKPSHNLVAILICCATTASHKITSPSVPQEKPHPQLFQQQRKRMTHKTMHRHQNA
jgi:hypothetical protein